MDRQISDEESSSSDSVVSESADDSHFEHLASEEEILNDTFTINLGCCEQWSDSTTTSESDSGLAVASNREVAKNNHEKMLAATSAMLNNVILDCVFGYLNVKYLKKCRLVCECWNAVAEPLLRKRAVIKFTYRSVKTPPSEFHNTFLVSNTSVPFTAIRFNKDGNWKKIRRPPSWPNIVLENLLLQWRNKLKTLKLYNIKVHEEYTTVARYNPHFCGIRPSDVPTMTIKRELHSYKLCPIIQSNLTSLTVNCLFATPIVVSLDLLQSLNHLDMSCNAILDIGISGKKITAKVVKLRQIKYLQNERLITDVVFNSFVDFSKTKTVQIDLDCSGTSINIGGNVTLDYLKLGEGINILGMEKSNWNIKKHLFLDAIPWMSSCTMKFSKGCFEDSDLDISTLPKEIECLRLREMKKVFSSTPFVFENLTYLSVREKFDQTCRSFLSLFKDCNNLTHLYIQSSAYQRTTINLNWIPPSARNLEFNKRLNIFGDGVIKPETAILSEWPLSDVNYCHVIRGIRPKYLVIATENLKDEEYAKYRSIKNLKQLVKSFRKTQKSVVIFLGPLFLKKSDYLFKKYVTKSKLEKGNFYFCFEGTKIEVVSKSEFQKFRTNKYHSMDDEFINP